MKAYQSAFYELVLTDCIELCPIATSKAHIFLMPEFNGIKYAPQQIAWSMFLYIVGSVNWHMKLCVHDLFQSETYQGRRSKGAKIPYFCIIIAQALFLNAFLVVFRTLLHASTMSQTIPDIHSS